MESGDTCRQPDMFHFFFFNDTATTEIYTLSLHDALPISRALLLRNNRPANLGGLPAISVPCGRTTEGLPVGLQLIGAAMDEALLLQIAQAFELARPLLQDRKSVV